MNAVMTILLELTQHYQLQIVLPIKFQTLQLSTPYIVTHRHTPVRITNIAEIDGSIRQSRIKHPPLRAKLALDSATVSPKATSAIS